MVGATNGAEQAARRVGRRLGVLALLFGGAYLVWRTGWSWRDDGSSAVAWWLAVPALVVEVLGFLATSLLIWALWSRPNAAAAGAGGDSGASGAGLSHDVVINVGDALTVDLRATLVALKLEPHPQRTFVVDRVGRPEVEAIAAEFGAGYLATDATDVTGLAAAREVSTADLLFLIDAGDIPVADAAAALQSSMADPSVAAAQGEVTTSSGDSAEHGPNGRHDLSFERLALNPALGVCGTSFLSGCGSLIRRQALDAIELPAGDRARAMWMLTAEFAARGLQVVAAGGAQVVTNKPLTSAARVAEERSARRAAAWSVLTDRDGAFRGLDIGIRRRVAMLVWTIGPLESIRRFAFTAVVLGALLAGRAPFAPNLAVMLATWAPAFVLTALALALLSGGTLRPGDRLRNSLRSVRVSVPLLVGINSVLVVRGISDRFTHAMRPLAPSVQVGLVIVALWVLAGCLDSLRLLARRHRARRAERVAASTTGTLGDATVHLADVTMLGAGLIADDPVEIGARLPLSFTMTSALAVSSLEVACIVRNVRADSAHTWRIGVEFVAPDSYVLDTLAECCVVLPTREALATSSASMPSPIEFANETEDDGATRVVLRAATLLALAAVVSSVAPVNVDASASRVRTLSGTIVAPADATQPEGSSDSVPTTAMTITTETGSSPPAAGSIPPDTAAPASSPVEVPESSEVPPASGDLGGFTVIAACSIDPGADGRFGTSDDTYLPSISTVTDDAGHYQLDVDGVACWLTINPPIATQSDPAASDLPPHQETDDPPPITSPAGPVVIDLGASNDHSLPPIVVEQEPRIGPRADATASIGDHVWLDANGDGAQQPDEDPVTGATVTLYDEGGRTFGSTSTDAYGSFSFAGLPKGLYSLGVTNLPSGLHVPGADVVTGRSPLITLAAGQHLRSADISVVGAASDQPVSLRSPLPEPTTRQLNAPIPRDQPTRWEMAAVIALAGLMAGSVLLASAWPIRGRSRTSR